MNIITKSGADKDPFEQSDRGGLQVGAGKGDSNRSNSQKFSAGYDETNLGKGQKHPGRTIYRFYPGRSA